MTDSFQEFLFSGFNVLLPQVVGDLDFSPDAITWPSNAFQLVSGAFLLPFGRLADMYGGYPVFLAGNVFMCAWWLVGGFSRNYIMLVISRAMQGLGAAAFLPSAISLLGAAYRPGRRKNIVFSLYGGCSPFGFFTGMLFAGVSARYLSWPWFFWIGCTLLAGNCLLIFLCIPRCVCEARKSMDWWGCCTLIPALMLLVYAITDSSHVAGGWRSPTIFVAFILGLASLAALVYVEGWVVKDALVPPDLFATKGITAFFVCLFLAFGSFGIYLLYASFFIQTVLNVQPMLAALWFAPLAVGGIIIGLSGVILDLVPGTFLLLLSASGFLVSAMLFAFMPDDDPNYWAWVFPAMVCATIGVDVMYNISIIFITTSLRADQHGMAGAFVNALFMLGISFFLSWADLAVSLGSREDTRYRIAFLLGAACAGAGIAIAALGIRIGRAKAQLTVEERERVQMGKC